jgi:hypothetical protein
MTIGDSSHISLHPFPAKVQKYTPITSDLDRSHGCRQHQTAKEKDDACQVRHDTRCNVPVRCRCFQNQKRRLEAERAVQGGKQRAVANNTIYDLYLAR